MRAASVCVHGLGRLDRGSSLAPRDREVVQYASTVGDVSRRRPTSGTTDAGHPPDRGRDGYRRPISAQRPGERGPRRARRRLGTVGLRSAVCSGVAGPAVPAAQPGPVRCVAVAVANGRVPVVAGVAGLLAVTVVPLLGAVAALGWSYSRWAQPAPGCGSPIRWCSPWSRCMGRATHNSCGMYHSRQYSIDACWRVVLYGRRPASSYGV